MIDNKHKTVYICGKVSGLPYDEVVAKFAAAEKYCREVLGFGKVINPLTINQGVSDWNTAMKRCIGNLVQCHTVFMLRDWPQSRGAVLERYISVNIGIEVIEGGTL